MAQTGLVIRQSSPVHKWFELFKQNNKAFKCRLESAVNLPPNDLGSKFSNCH